MREIDAGGPRLVRKLENFGLLFMRLLRPFGKGWCPVGAAERHPARNAGLSRQSGWCSPVMEVTNAQPDTAMTLPKNVAELQGENVLFELECIDRMYLNLYVPELTSAVESRSGAVELGSAVTVSDPFGWSVF